MQESDWVYGLGGIGKKVRRYCPDDAISCCMYRESEVLQQPIPSHNDYRGTTCLIRILWKKSSQSINGWQTKLCLKEKHTARHKNQNESLNSIYKLNSIRKYLSSC